MKLSQKHLDYWQKNLVLTSILIVIWFFVTYVIGYFAIDLQNVTFLGFPIAFYMGAQGSIIIYIAIIGYYARYMNRLDREYGVQEGEEQ